VDFSKHHKPNQTYLLIIYVLKKMVKTYFRKHIALLFVQIYDSPSNIDELN
jgi:hypothetical protein